MAEHRIQTYELVAPTITNPYLFIYLLISCVYECVRILWIWSIDQLERIAAIARRSSSSLPLAHTFALSAPSHSGLVVERARCVYAIKFQYDFTAACIDKSYDLIRFFRSVFSVGFFVVGRARDCRIMVSGPFLYCSRRDCVRFHLHLYANDRREIIGAELNAIRVLCR